MLTETLINEKLKSETITASNRIYDSTAVTKVDERSIVNKQITSQNRIHLEQVLQTNGNQYIESQLNNYYTKHQNQTIASLLPNQLVTFLDQHVDNATDLLCDRARNYLSSAKGTQDINDMLDTFFHEE